MEERFGALTALAARQRGLCTYEQLTAVGYHRATIHRMLADKRLERAAPHVFRLPGAPLPWPAKMLAQQLSIGEAAIVSHRSAACLYDLDGFDPGLVVHLTVPGAARPRPRKNVVLHRSSDYALAGRRLRQGVPVTSVPRLILDLCASEKNIAIPRRALHSARKKNLVTWGALDECLRLHAKQGRAGIEVFRWLLERFSGKGSPESGLEDDVLDLILQAGLPEPVIQYRTVSGGRRRRIDLVYPAQRVLIECKGKKDHLTEEAFEADPLRENELNIDGWTVLVFTPLQVMTDPEGVISQVRRALEARPTTFS